MAETSHKPDEDATTTAVDKKLRQLCNKYPWSPEGMNAHLAEFASIMRDAKACGVSYTPDKKAKLFMTTIPPTSLPFHSLHAHGQNFDDLKTAWYQLQKSLAWFADNRPSDPPPTKQLIQSNGGQGSRGQPRQTMETRTCYWCQREGHIQANCQDRKEARAQAVEKARKERGSKLVDASKSSYYFRKPPPSRDQLAAVLHITTQGMRHVWICDSGAELHVTSHDELLPDKVRDSKLFITANGHRWSNLRGSCRVTEISTDECACRKIWIDNLPDGDQH